MAEDFNWDEKIKEAKENGWIITRNDEDVIRFEQHIEGGHIKIMEYYKKFEMLYPYDSRLPVKFVFGDVEKKENENGN